MRSAFVSALIMTIGITLSGCKENTNNPTNTNTDTQGMNPPAWLIGTWENVEKSERIIVTANNYQMFSILPEFLLLDTRNQLIAGMVTSDETVGVTYIIHYDDGKLETKQIDTETIEVTGYEQDQAGQATTYIKS